MMSLYLWILGSFMVCVRGEFVEPPPSFSMRSLAEAKTRLPCRFQVEPDQVVVQVSWARERPDGTKEQIITAHRTEGHTEFGRFSGRVRFESGDPTMNSALLILSTEEADDGRYTCHISTFPSGNFERELSLIVWTTPISTLDPLTMVEGQAFGLAASCRSVAHPLPSLSWDTDLAGQSLNRSSGGAVSIHFLLYPLRSMNGKKLDCLVWHAALERPRRLSNNLVVQYPPDASISGFDRQWFVGMVGAGLQCESGGNPKPRIFTWTRVGRALPEGATAANGTLRFNRPLEQTDAGVYECVATNPVGSGKTSVKVTVSESREKPIKNMLILMVGAAAGGLVMILLIVVIVLTIHHKRKKKALKKELDIKKEEISCLSRQASMRGMNSVSTDHRTEESSPLRVEGTLRTSMSSLGEQARCRDSRSTLSGGRGGGSGLDHLGRPMIYNSSRRGRERTVLERDGERDDSRYRLETFVQNSTMSLEPHFHPPLQPSPFPMEQSAEIVRPLNGNAIMPGDGGYRSARVNNYPLTDEEEAEEFEERQVAGDSSPGCQVTPDDQYSETNSSQNSEVTSQRFEQTNGTLRPKPHSNGISLSTIHKAQIV